MSSPSSPADNDNTPRFHSPSPTYSSSPLQLTPRSKIRALLADQDDESDEESTPIGIGLAATRPLSTISHNAQREVAEAVEEQPVKPRGSLASRLFKAAPQTGIVKSTESTSEESGKPQENAYDRIRKQLMGGAEEEKVTKEPVTAQSELALDEEEDDLPVQPHRRERRVKAAIESKDVSPNLSPEMVKGTSSGLFVSPSPSPSKQKPAIPSAQLPSDSEDSDAGLPENPEKNSRFLELVQRKRQERLEKEAEEASKKKERDERMNREAKAVLGIDSEEESEGDVEARLTQQARPTRKASKKAHEEIQRETQRMTRNMQLTHEARTRKKVTKQSLFDRFNYKSATSNGKDEEVDTSPDKTASSAIGSEAEMPHSTPPTSPPSYSNSPEKKSTSIAAEGKQAVLTQPTSLEMKLLPQEAPVEGKGALIHADKDWSAASTDFVVLGTQVGEPEAAALAAEEGKNRFLPSRRAYSKRKQVDSDDEIEILPKSKKISIWDRKPEQKKAHSSSLFALRALANLTSPSRQKSGGKAMTSGELHTSLQQRARQQAKRERDDRLQQLRDRGIIVQTTEERAEEQAEVDNLLARAREEDGKLSKKEKAAAKKDNESGSQAGLDDDSDGEKDWSEGNSQAESELSDDGSGSENDGEDEGEDEDAGSEDDQTEDEDGPTSQVLKSPRAGNNPALIDIEASESDDNSDENIENEAPLDDGENADDSDIGSHTVSKKTRKPRRALVLSDDEEDDVDNTKINVPSSNHYKASTTPISAKKTLIPGLPTPDQVPLGLTQIFAGTMDDSQSQEEPSQPLSKPLDQEQTSPTLLRLSPQLDTFGFDETPKSQACVPDSQVQVDLDEPISRLQRSQSQVGPHYVRDSFFPDSPSQYSDFPDPTQDVGFQNSSPILDRFARPSSTLETVLLPNQETPVPKKKGRLVKRAMIPDLSDDESALPEKPADNDAGEFHISSDIFDVMRNAKKRKEKSAVEFSKKKSDAKGMVEEQAEESEDEYAGLGGASDDDSGVEDAEFARDMLDDDAPDADERQLAAFYANKERDQDEKQVEKLFRDITNGTLRRKRGADYDLSDSDDEGEARRKRKQREFAKMRKALLEDEEIGKIATNPKKEAFMRSIEDREMDDEVNFLEDEDAPFQIGAEYSQVIPASQDVESQEKAIPPSSMSGNHKHPEKQEEARLPPHLRRTKGSRPSTLAEIRASLSFLIAEPNENESMHAELESSDIEIEQDEVASQDNISKENQPSTSSDPTLVKPHPRRTAQTSEIVDRLSLLRQSSSLALSNASNNGPVAFAASSDAPVFRVPSLLRRATTSSTTGSLASSSTGETERSAGGSEDKRSSVKRGGGKGGSVNFLLRESHKKGAVDGVEKRRMEVVKKKKAERRGALSILRGSWG